jgi:hypothetical protein
VSVRLEPFAQHLTQNGLMSATEVTAFQNTLPPDRKPQDAESLARECVRANKLTDVRIGASSRIALDSDSAGPDNDRPELDRDHRSGHQ